MTVSTNIDLQFTYFGLCLLYSATCIYPVPAVRIFHFQDSHNITNPAGLSPCILPWKCKGGPMPSSRNKNWRQKSGNPALFPRMSPGSTQLWNYNLVFLSEKYKFTSFILKKDKILQYWIHKCCKWYIETYAIQISRAIFGYGFHVTVKAVLKPA